MLKENTCSNCREILYSPVLYCPFCGSVQNVQAAEDTDSVSNKLPAPPPQVKTEIPGDPVQNHGIPEALTVTPTRPIDVPVESSTEEPERLEPEKQSNTGHPTPTTVGESDTTLPPQAVPHPLPNTSTPPTKDRSDWKKILSGRIGKILLVFGGTTAAIVIVFLSLSGGSTPEAPDSTQLKPANILGPDFIKNYLAQSPDKYDALNTARRLEKAGRLDKAFLIYRYAERLGVGKASTAIAQLYDPTFSGRIESPLKPNKHKALELYKRGIDRGDPAASVGLSRLVNGLNQQEKHGDGKAR